jgi:hypothetical protein
MISNRYRAYIIVRDVYKEVDIVSIRQSELAALNERRRCLRSMFSAIGMAIGRPDASGHRLPRM